MCSNNVSVWRRTMEVVYPNVQCVSHSCIHIVLPTVKYAVLRFSKPRSNEFHLVLLLVCAHTCSCIYTLLHVVHTYCSTQSRIVFVMRLQSPCGFEEVLPHTHYKHTHNEVNIPKHFHMMEFPFGKSIQKNSRLMYTFTVAI